MEYATELGAETEEHPHVVEEQSPPLQQRQQRQHQPEMPTGLRWSSSRNHWQPENELVILSTSTNDAVTFYRIRTGIGDPSLVESGLVDKRYNDFMDLKAHLKAEGLDRFKELFPKKTSGTDARQTKFQRWLRAAVGEHSLSHPQVAAFLEV